MDKEQLEQRKQALLIEIDKQLATLNQLEGMAKECDFWLGKIGEKTDG